MTDLQLSTEATFKFAIDEMEPARVTTRVLSRSFSGSRWAKKSSMASFSSSAKMQTEGFFSLSLASMSSRKISTTRCASQPKITVCSFSMTWEWPLRNCSMRSMSQVVMRPTRADMRMSPDAPAAMAGIL